MRGVAAHGLHHPHEAVEHHGDAPKVNAFCVLSQDNVRSTVSFYLKETLLQDQSISKWSKTGYSLYCKQIRMTSFFKKMEHRSIGTLRYELIGTKK